MVSGPGVAPYGVSTLTVSAVAETIVAGVATPGKTTDTAAGLNFSCAVDAIASGWPPFGVVVDKAPRNASGNVTTRTESLTPPPLATMWVTPNPVVPTTARADVAGIA